MARVYRIRTEEPAAGIVVFLEEQEEEEKTWILRSRIEIEANASGIALEPITENEYLRLEFDARNRTLSATVVDASSGA